jgi:hypothetical protein
MRTVKSKFNLNDSSTALPRAFLPDRQGFRFTSPLERPELSFSTVMGEVKYKISVFAVALFGILSINGCSKSDTFIIDEKITNTIAFTAKVNGENFKIPTIAEFAGASVSILPEFYLITIIAIDIQEGTNHPKNIALTMMGDDFNSLEVGRVFNTVAPNITSEGALAGYSENILNDRDKAVFNFEDIEEISIKVTALDRKKKIISGEFNFKGLDAETNTWYSVTEGKFANLLYKLKEN